MNDGLKILRTDILKFLSDTRYRNRALHDFEMKLGRVRLFSKPLSLLLESTNRCNLYCVMCARPYYNRERNILGDMSIETFEKVSPLLKYAETVYLSGYGEPLIAKNFWHFLRECSKAGAETVITSNGVKLDAETSRRLTLGGLGAIGVSLDAAREETFIAIRKTSLKKIVDNLKGLKKVKEELRSTKPALSINFVLMKDNLDELPDLIDLADEVGAGGVSVNHLKMYSRKLEEQSAFHYQEKAKEIFHKAKQKAFEKGIHLTLPDLGATLKDCLQPYELLYINWDGTVRACCSAGFVNEEYGTIIGHVDESPAENIWNNELMVSIRKGLLGKGKIPKVCANCGFRITEIKAFRRYLD